MQLVKIEKKSGTPKFNGIGVLTYPRGAVALTPAAFNALKRPPMVDVFYDDEQHVIVVAPCTDGKGYKLRIDARTINARALLQLKWLPRTNTFFKGVIENGRLIIRFP